MIATVNSHGRMYSDPEQRLGAVAQERRVEQQRERQPEHEVDDHADAR